MNEKLRDYSLLELNKDLSELVKDKKVNNLNMFVAAERKGKLSVTVKPDQSKKEIYHGLRPDFDEDGLRLFLKNLKSNNAIDFWNAIEKIQRDNKIMNLIIPDFLTDKEVKEDYLLQLINNQKLKENLELNLLGKAVLQMVSHFGYEIVAEDKETYNSFKTELSDILKLNSLFYQCDEKNKTVKLLGILPEQIIVTLCEKFDIDITKDKLVLKICERNKSNNNLYELLTFKKDSDLVHFKLVTSDVYYSGVMPCVKGIEYEKNASLSDKVKYIVFNVVRTTYATVDAMDNSNVLEHPFFNEEPRAVLTKFDNYEDILQNKYLYCKYDESNLQYNQNKYERHMIENLNNYLKYSLNTHTIAVSTNLITEDGYLIAGKRGNLNIDSGEYYCSANGQTEFRDENVSFYRKSVFEDMPTMDYFSKYRVDLNREIERECIAELGAASYGVEWNYYGVSYLSINNHREDSKNISIEKSSQAKSRRMHFNVLSSNSLSQSFKEVIKTHRTATESFENESIVGIKTKVFKDKMDLLKSIVSSIYSWLDKNKSSIFLLLIFISVLIGNRDYDTLDISNYADMFFLVVYFTISIKTWKNNQYIRKQSFTKCYYLPSYCKDDGFEIQKVLKNLSKKANEAKFHGIFDIMYILYFLNLTEE